MIRILRLIPAAVAVAAVAACNTTDADVERALDPLNVIDETNLADIMLSAASPNEAVDYFRRAAQEDPTRIDLQRGLATSLVRAGRAAEALTIWQGVIDHDGAMDQDRVDYADALIRTGDWDGAQAQLDATPPTFETYERYRLEAMIADSEEDWDRADSFYETAAGLTTRPANVYNNWGYSHLTRGDYPGAEELFVRAISYDPELFTAKNNLVLARAAQGNYTLPLINMNQVERAQLLHTAALSAIRRGDIDEGRGLLNEAIDTHPQHFEAAVEALRALNA
ncbi:tetratricopeptide repeat protein [Rhodobacteraceae bacterium N5(2021)]|uniref:Tetratricopeptide repeat protein n=1 Tax=Gymnodinialimonas phycosphaerae TaxID=2841589 RepID=A0A975TUT8_9RHOB|nr:tetratricopeptide repeat protein [Gymnodinialimonas phycosphaerae]MBY4895032.1 tetratricopeptide repeat protein [Gymnodinialimonas phycosphaerae]